MTEMICDDLNKTLSGVTSHIRAINYFSGTAAAQQQYTRDKAEGTPGPAPQDSHRRGRAHLVVSPMGTTRWDAGDGLLVFRVLPAVFYSNLSELGATHYYFTAVYRRFWRCIRVETGAAAVRRDAAQVWAPPGACILRFLCKYPGYYEYPNCDQSCYEKPNCDSDYYE